MNEINQSAMDYSSYTAR